MTKKEICTSCNSNNIVMNGLTSGNRQKFHCKDCGCYRTIKTTQYYTNERKEEILVPIKNARAYEKYKEYIMFQFRVFFAGLKKSLTTGIFRINRNE